MTRFGYLMTTYFAALGVAGGALSSRRSSSGTRAPAFQSDSTPFVPPALCMSTSWWWSGRREALAAFLDERRYLAKGVPMLKHILALPGQTVCRTDRTITVDGVAVGDALDRDSRGRPLPAWQGCRVVADDEVFLMNWQSKDSLDGRYFGPLPASTVVGRADPLWTREGD